MAKKNFWFVMSIMVLTFGTTVMSCKTTVPILYTDNVNKEFTILGEVIIKPVVNQWTGSINYGFTDLLNAARQKYPDCDYVIDIMIDQVKIDFVPFVGNKKGFIVRGTAIKYKT